MVLLGGLREGSQRNKEDNREEEMGLQTEDYEQQGDIPDQSKDFEGDAEMTPSEVGTKDPKLQELIEGEGINLQDLAEQAKK